MNAQAVLLHYKSALDYEFDLCKQVEQATDCIMQSMKSFSLSVSACIETINSDFPRKFFFFV